MRKISTLAILLATTVALTSCLGGVSTNSGVAKPGEAKSGFMGLSKTDDIVVTEADAFKGAKDVTIASFKVGFVESGKHGAKAGGGLMGSGMGGNSKAKMKLTGVSDEDQQAITEAAYKNFISQLKAKGYNVESNSALMAHKDYKDTKTYEDPYEDSGIKFFTPKDLKPMRFFAGDSASASGGFAFGNPMMGAVSYAKETGTKVLSVTYMVDFSNADSYGGSFKMSSSVNVGQGISVTPGSKINMIGGEGGGTFGKNPNGALALGQSVYSTKEFGKIVGTTSDTMKVAEGVLNVATALLGAGTNQTREFEIQANPAKYRAVSGEVLSDANKALVGKMSSLK